MQRYVFNPTMDKPLRFIHPIQMGSIALLLSEPFPDYVDYVILFGGSLDLSCGVDSDLDLYIISEHDPKEVYKEIYYRCRNIGRPFDILVSSYGDFISESSVFGTVEYQILREGLCLYAKTQDNIARTG